jgi:serine protease Do
MRLPPCRPALVAALFVGSFAMSAVGASAEGDASGYMDHAARTRAFVSEMTRLYETGQCASVEDLDRQAREEKGCSLSLPGRRKALGPVENAYESACESIAVMGRIYKCGKCEHWHLTTATAFVVRPDGVLLTNFHVVEKDEQGKALGVMLHDGRVLPVRRVLASSKEDDLAVIKVDADKLQPLTLARSCRVGEPVSLISHPVEHFYTLTEGIVSSKLLHGPRDHERPRLTITADFGKGSSGAPVFNRAGAVVGIVHSTTAVFYDRGENPPQPQMVWKYCIPSTAVFELFAP